MFAIMGLRSLYTILSKAASELEYLEPAVAIVLGFIGTKMVAEYFGVLVPTELSLAVVATLLSGGVLASIIDKKDELVEELVPELLENDDGVSNS
jgi:predicted tellurium resistance membrane protein TerC